MKGNAAFKEAIVLTPVASDIAMAAAEAEAMKNGWEVTICICDAGGIPIQVKRNAFPASYDIAVGKAKTAALFGRATGTLFDDIFDESTNKDSVQRSPFILSKGGVPFKVDGVVCGAVGVSGATPKQDEQIANAAVAALADLVWSKRVFESEQADLLNKKKFEAEQAEALPEAPKKRFSLINN
mmetsp:Transcript_26767/g.39597  ORF Transcript_26767/g.39597 Transcript_26767/m.39597 type:complete len:183 (+) Transcript_26767:70-618(+)